MIITLSCQELAIGFKPEQQSYVRETCFVDRAIRGRRFDDLRNLWLNNFGERRKICYDDSEFSPSPGLHLLGEHVVRTGFSPSPKG